MPLARAQGPRPDAGLRTLGGQKPGAWSLQTLQVGEGAAAGGGVGALLRGFRKWRGAGNEEGKGGPSFLSQIFFMNSASSPLETCQFLDFNGFFSQAEVKETREASWKSHVSSPQIPPNKHALSALNPLLRRFLPLSARESSRTSIS